MTIEFLVDQAEKESKLTPAGTDQHSGLIITHSVDMHTYVLRSQREDLAELICTPGYRPVIGMPAMTHAQFTHAKQRCKPGTW